MPPWLTNRKKLLKYQGLPSSHPHQNIHSSYPLLTSTSPTTAIIIPILLYPTILISSLLYTFIQSTWPAHDLPLPALLHSARHRVAVHPRCLLDNQLHLHNQHLFKHNHTLQSWLSLPLDSPDSLVKWQPLLQELPWDIPLVTQ